MPPDKLSTGEIFVQIRDALRDIRVLLGGSPIELPPPIEDEPISKLIPAKIFDIDLSVAHDDIPLGLRDTKMLANSLTILAAPSSFSIKQDNTNNDPLTATEGMEISDEPMKEIFYTNAAASGTGQIRMVWSAKAIEK